MTSSKLLPKCMFDCTCPPSLKSCVTLTFPLPLGAVPQSYLRCCLSDCVLTLPQIKFNSQLSGCAFFFFSVDSHKKAVLIENFSSVAQSCLTLWDSMDCSTPGFLVPHHLPELWHEFSLALLSSSYRSSLKTHEILELGRTLKIICCHPVVRSLSLSL